VISIFINLLFTITFLNVSLDEVVKGNEFAGWINVLSVITGASAAIYCTLCYGVLNCGTIFGMTTNLRERLFAMTVGALCAGFGAFVITSVTLYIFGGVIHQFKNPCIINWYQHVHDKINEFITLIGRGV
jgi:hypothetical protein